MPRAIILRGRKLFKEVFNKGRYTRGRWFDVVALAAANREGKAAFAASRRVARAKDRNRIKRRLREAFRLERGVEFYHHAVFVGHESSLKVKFETLRLEMRHTLAKLCTACFPTA